MRTQTPRFTNRPMSNTELQTAAPSIFATEPWHKMSARYTFIPTIQVVDEMRANGFEPFSAVQSRTRIEGKAEFTRHCIRFRQAGIDPIARHLGMITPELVLTNSHDGASAYKIEAGLFRLVCLNGMTVSAGTIEGINVRHTGSADGIINASYQLVDEMPKALEAAENMAALQLSAPAREAFGEAALTVKYGEDPAPIAARQILQPRRAADQGASLWNTLNVVQEHLVQGGVHGRSASGRRFTTRTVQGISESGNLNRALWQLAERMAQLAK